MRMFRSFTLRLIMLAVLVAVVPASSRASVFISVGFAPPALPVYEQPPCPEQGWMWTPGYWAYGDDGYYWVPGEWVPAPYAGALWTPGYWGWNAGLYMWHPGYWGRHVGYYGGVNYGFGYMGVGFVGGLWRGSVFSYNTAIVHVNTTIIRNTYVDRTIVERNTIMNDRRIAYNGGPGGIRHEALAQERVAEHDQHMERTSFQTQHVNEAMHDRGSYFNSNHGRPAMMASGRPSQAQMHEMQNPHAGGNANFQGHVNENARPAFNGGPEAHGQGQFHAAPEQHNAPQYRAAPESHAQPQYRAAPESHAQPQFRSAPEQHNRPQFHPAPQEHSAPPREENHGGGGGHQGGHEGGHEGGHGR